MLNSLAAQLGHPETEKDSLTNQVLRELRRRRLDELRDGQSKLKDQQAELQRGKRLEEYSEWKPFFESLGVAIESELRQLLKTQADRFESESDSE